MIETNSPGPSNGQTNEPKPEQVQQTSQGQGKGTPRPLQHPKPGRMPLFRR
jgi:hypothetical protein